MANQYWVGSDTSWNTAANWASTSGGSDSTGPPASGDAVLFDGGGTGNCTLDVDAQTVASLTISSGYSSVLDFADSGYSFTCSGAFTAAGTGTLDFGTSQLSLQGACDISGQSTVTTGTGTITFSGGNTQSIDLDDQTVGAITVNKSGGTLTFASGFDCGTFTASGTSTAIVFGDNNNYYVDEFLIPSKIASLNPGANNEFHCRGDWLTYTAGIYFTQQNTTWMYLYGAANDFEGGYLRNMQNCQIAAGASYDITHSSGAFYGSYLIIEGELTSSLGGPTAYVLTVASTGTLNCTGTTTVNGTFTVQSGGSAQMGNLYQGGYSAGVLTAGTEYTVTGEHRIWTNRASGSTTSVLPTSFICHGNLRFLSTSTGELIVDTVTNNTDYQVDGNLTIEATGGGAVTYNAGTGSITFNGTGDQTVDFDGESVEDIVIDKASGDVVLAGNATCDSVTIDDGGLDIDSYDLTVGGTFTATTGAAAISVTDTTGGGSIAITGALTLTGVATYGIVWAVDGSCAGATSAAHYTDVQNSTMTVGGTDIDATDNCTDTGTNSGWNFGGAAFGGFSLIVGAGIVS